MRWIDVSEDVVRAALNRIPMMGLLAQASDDDEASMAAALGLDPHRYLAVDTVHGRWKVHGLQATAWVRVHPNHAQ